MSDSSWRSCVNLCLSQFCGKSNQFFPYCKTFKEFLQKYHGDTFFLINFFSTQTSHKSGKIQKKCVYATNTKSNTTGPCSDSICFSSLGNILIFLWSSLYFSLPNKIKERDFLPSMSIFCFSAWCKLCTTSHPKSQVSWSSAEEMSLQLLIEPINTGGVGKLALAEVFSQQPM